MEKKTFTSLLAEARAHLSASRLADALSCLRPLVEGMGEWELKAGLSDLESAYGLMLHYFREGVPDSSRHSLYRSFLRRSYELCDRAERQFRLRMSATLYYETIRTLQVQSVPLGERVARLEDNCQGLALKFSATSGYSPERHEMERQHAELVRGLFDCVWTSAAWSAEDAEVARDMMASPLIREADQALMVGAVTMGLLQTFDSSKFAFLMDYVLDGRSLIGARAITGFALALLRYDRRLALYPDLTARLKLLADDSRFVASLRRLQMQLLTTLETRDIERQLREDIIPAMMHSPHFKRTKFGFEEIDEMLKGNDPNPDWRENEEVKRIENKLRQLAELQSQGADVYMGTFAAMKQQFPFFGAMVSWFLPFDAHHPALYSRQELPKFLRTLSEAGVLCDSDQYSFAFMLASIPAAQRRMMDEQLAAMGMTEPLQVGQAVGRSEREERSCRLYLQDLYRFFRLFNRRSQFDNPFEQNVILADCQVLGGGLLTDGESLAQLADFAFKRKFYAAALRFFGGLQQKAAPSADVCQKMGYCHQMQGAYAEAVAAYGKALLLEGDNAWTLRHLAQCHRLLGQYGEALDYWKELERLQPDDLQVQYRVGEGLILAGRPDEAFPYLYKVDYLDPGRERTQRALAWCSLLAHKPEQAVKYYQKLLAAHPAPEDHQNAGHAAWALGDVAAALSHYADCLRAKGLDVPPEDFFDEDAALLATYAIKPDDLRIARDALRVEAGRTTVGA